MKRREFLSTVAMLAGAFDYRSELASAGVSPRPGRRWQPQYSICSEIFEGWSVEKTAPVIAKIGYKALEIAPFWLAEHVDAISTQRRKEIRRVLSDHGLVCSGLHWLLITPKWLHVTTPDEKVRSQSWEYVGKLIDLCADLGGKAMVLGSPKQRTSLGIPAPQAVDNLVAGLRQVAPHAGERGVFLCMEPIPRNQQCDVVNTMAEAAGVVKRVNHPAVQSMFDVHNTADETESADRLIHQYAPIVRHVHINEMDGSYPGSRGYDFKPVFRALKEINYRGWTSLEVFDFKPGAEKIARESMDFMKRVAAQVS
ncbi:MAG TPA: sugar phosphate isomerase/epimerase family protein [Acidobacteriota bacterium]|jgi:sugar phosphate isomerase/epimerase